MKGIARQGTELSQSGSESVDAPLRHKFAKALYDFAANERDELLLEEEDVVQLLKTDADGGWLFGLKNGTWGWFPANFVRILTDEEVSAEGITEYSELNDSESMDWRGGLSRPSSIPSISPGQVGSQGSLGVDESSKSLTGGSGVQTRNWAAKYKAMPRYSKRVSGTGLDELEAAIGTHIKEALARPKVEPVPATPEETSSDKPSSAARRASSFSKRSLRGMGSLNDRKTTVALVGQPHVSRQRWVEVMGGADEVAKLGLTRKDIQRQEVIHEMHQTEKDYVEDLEIIINVYMNPLKEKKLLQTKDMSIVFSNVEQLLPVNQQLLKWIEDRLSQGSVVEQVGDIFIRVSDFLKMYTMYCRNHPFALMKLQAVRQNKSVAKFLDSCVPESRNLNLANFLIKPVQRICKYPLLIREVMKNTEPDHPDFENLEKALLKIQTVVTIVNEGARQAEAVQKMLELQGRFTTKMNSIVTPWRLLLKSGPMDLIVSNGERKKREVFLFNDMLLIAKALGGEDQKLKLVDMVSFEMILINIPSVGTDHVIEIVHINTNKYHLACFSADVKQSWIDSLKEATKSWMAQKNRGSPGTAAPTPIEISSDSPVSAPQMDQIAEATAKFVQPPQLTRHVLDESTSESIMMDDDVVIKEDVADEDAAPPVQALRSFQAQKSSFRGQAGFNALSRPNKRRTDESSVQEEDDETDYSASPMGTPRMGRANMTSFAPLSPSPYRGPVSVTERLRSPAESSPPADLPAPTIKGQTPPPPPIRQKKPSDNTLNLPPLPKKVSPVVPETARKESLGGTPAPVAARKDIPPAAPATMKESATPPACEVIKSVVEDPVSIVEAAFQAVLGPIFAKSGMSEAAKPERRPESVTAQPPLVAPPVVVLNSELEEVDGPAVLGRPVSKRFKSNPFIVQDQAAEQLAPRNRSATVEANPAAGKTKPHASHSKLETPPDEKGSLPVPQASSPHQRRASHAGHLSMTMPVPQAAAPKLGTLLAGPPRSGVKAPVPAGKRPSLDLNTFTSAGEKDSQMSRPTSISIPSPTSPKLQNVVTPPAAAEDTPKSTPILGGRPRTRSKSNTLINKPVKRAVVTEVIKPQSAGSRASAGKDYVYLIDVYHVGVPEEQPPMTIRQTYDDFFDFHMQLIGHFPEEGGVRAGLTKQNSEGVNSMPGGWSEAPKRIIPELPGQMMFVSEAAAQGRVALLHDYIQAILALPPKISRSPVTMNFFRMDGKHVLSLGES